MRSLVQLNLKENERIALQCLKEMLVARFPDAEIIIYGSKARGDFDEESDIDVLILLECDVDTKLEKEIIELVYDIELEHDVVIGLLMESKDFWNSDLANAMPIHWNIDKEGIVL
ncbi:MAG: nucleotidyltransferase domain-containing protein [bacterium]